MKARVATSVHLSDSDTGEQIVTAKKVGARGLVAIDVGGAQLTIYGTPDQLHLLAASISNELNALEAGGES